MHKELEMMNAQVASKTRFNLNQNMIILVTPPSMGYKGRVEVISNNETTRHIGFMDDLKDIKSLIKALNKLI